MAANKKKHLREEERFCIEKMLRAGDSFGKIGRTLGRGLSTISEEVNANGGREVYDAQKAEHRAYLKQWRKKRNCNKVAMDSHLTKFVEKNLERGWSPETISVRLKVQSGIGYASSKSIRKYIGKRHGLERHLFWERNNVKSGAKKGGDIFLHDPLRKSIAERPYAALYEYGHWEGDFIVSKHNAWVLLVLVEKFSKTVRLALLPNRNNELVNEAIVTLLREYTVKTLTLDNDIAFSKWILLEAQLGARIYFCHPYHSWEKGLVENTNRWLRQFVPKKSDLALFTKKYVAWVEAWFNHTPRQCLEGSTAYERMMEEEFRQSVQSLEVNLPRLRIGW
jgi:transposase, IS30 family